MRRTLGIVTSLLLVAAVGCKKEEAAPKKPAETKKAPDAGKPPAPAPDAAVAMKAPEPEQGGEALVGKGKMEHCPSAVEGAATKIANTKDGVTVTVTAKDEKDTKSVDEIRARAKHMAEASAKEAKEKDDKGEAPKHTGEGEGGGGSGKCPVVMKGTVVTAKDVKGGSELMVKASDAKQVDWLQKESASRLEKMAAMPAPAPGAGGEKAVPAGGEAKPDEKAAPAGGEKKPGGEMKKP